MQLVIPGGHLLLEVPELGLEAQLCRWDVGPDLAVRGRAHSAVACRFASAVERFRNAVLATYR
jgi:hypothetical protein